MPQNKQSFSEKSYKFKVINYKYLIPIVLIVILTIIGIIFTVSKTQAIPPSTSNNTSEVEVRSSDNLLPENTAKPDNSSDNSVQNGAATIEDLGGNKNSHQNIDDLLKDKEIDVE